MEFRVCACVSYNQRSGPLMRIHSIDVYVRDLERSLRFYRDKLGFEILSDAHLASGLRRVSIAPPGSNAVLNVIQPEREGAEHKLIGRSIRVAFSTDDVAATFRLWNERGVRFRHAPRMRRVQYRENGQPAHLEGEVFTRFEDPDRNSFTLVSNASEATESES